MQPVRYGYTASIAYLQDNGLTDYEQLEQRATAATERFHKLSTDYEAEQAGLQTQAAILREEIEEVEGKSANVDRFLSVVRQYTDIPELTPRILHEFVEKIVIHAATDPHSKINRRQEVDIYYKGIGILEMSKVFDSRQK